MTHPVTYSGAIPETQFYWKEETGSENVIVKIVMKILDWISNLFSKKPDAPIYPDLRRKTTQFDSRNRKAPSRSESYLSATSGVSKNPLFEPRDSSPESSSRAGASSRPLMNVPFSLGAQDASGRCLTTAQIRQARGLS